MDFVLNFLGLVVMDFNRSFDFYTTNLGIESSHSSPGWAWFDTRGMMFELFGSQQPQQEQAFCPCLSISDLPSTVTALGDKGVRFVGEIAPSLWGESIEFVAPEGIHWRLAQALTTLPEQSIRNPRLAGVELKVHDLVRQRAFYTQVMGLHAEDIDRGHVVCRQRPGEPILVLAPGEARVSALQTPNQPSSFLSFETYTIERASAWLKRQDLTIIEDVTQREWGGIDLLIGDGDGNCVQVVQYLTHDVRDPSIPRPREGSG